MKVDALKTGELLKTALKATQLFETKGESDTIRLWENFRDQAHMWRALALCQVPTCFLLVVFSVLLWATRSITLNVPAKPLPGVYVARDIPDTEFIEYATDFINLVASYQSAVARRQFVKAKEMLREPMLARFEMEMMQEELKAIENTGRTQIFFADPSQTQIERFSEQEALVTFMGDRIKLVAGQELPAVVTKFTVTMTTVPRQPLNPYGIVITNVTFENVIRKPDASDRRGGR